MSFAVGPVAPGSENGGAVKAAGGRETAGTDDALAVRAAELAAWRGLEVSRRRGWIFDTVSDGELRSSCIHAEGTRPAIRHCNTVHAPGEQT